MRHSSLLRALVLGVVVSFGAALAQQATLSFWSWRVEDKEFYEETAKQFEAQTGVKVTFTPHPNANYATILNSALAAGSGPDIIHTRAYGGLAQLADAGYLMPLTNQMVPALRNYNTALLNAARGFQAANRQRIFGVPFATQTLGIFYNKELLQKAGITQLPATWSEFKQALAKAKAANVIPLANGGKDVVILEQVFGVVGPMFYGGSGFFNAVVAGQRRFTDPVFVRAIQETAALREFMPPNFMGIGENEARALFFGGQAAFIMTGTWNIGFFREQNPKLDFGFMPAPPLVRGGTPMVSTFADGNYSINAKTANRDAAVKFINFLASKEFGQQFTEKLAQASAVPGVSAKDPILQEAMQARARFGTPYLMLVGFRYQTPTGSELLRNGIQRILQDQATPQQVAEEVQKGVATWYAPQKQQ